MARGKHVQRFNVNKSDCLLFLTPVNMNVSSLGVTAAIPFTLSKLGDLCLVFLIARCFIQVVLFVLWLNNAVFAHRIPMTVHTIFRSRGLIISMIIGSMASIKRYVYGFLAEDLSVGDMNDFWIPCSFQITYIFFSHVNGHICVILSSSVRYTLLVTTRS